MDCVLHHGDCLAILPTLESSSVDCVFTDPPYAEIDREYGRLTEPQWHELMHGVVKEIRRILKPSGSAVFVIQPNSEKVGRMRLWVWEFMVWLGREWNIVQDAYWWNHTTFPTIHCQRQIGLMRPSVKNCIWVGSHNCYREQSEVLWTQSESMKATSLEDRSLRYHPCGVSVRPGRMKEATDSRGGSTPFNLLPMANSDSSGKQKGHPASTPMKLAEWWIKYICPPGGTVLDPFTGSGTTGVAAKKLGRSFVGIEQFDKYFAIASERLKTPDFMGSAV